PGEVAEWLMAPVLKTGLPERVSGVRIPPSPPRSLNCRESWLFYLASTRIMLVFRDYSKQTGLRRTDCSAPNAVSVLAFLRKALAQSGFEEGFRRMSCDHKPAIRPSELTFCRALETDFRASHRPVSGSTNVHENG